MRVSPIAVALVLISTAPHLSAAAEVRYAAWDRLYYKVKVPVEAVNPEGRLTLLVYHSYPMPLTGVTVSVDSPLFRLVAASPTVMEKMDPTIIKSFTLRLRRTAARPTRQASYHIAAVTLRARELPGPKSISVPVPTSAAGEKAVAELLALPVGIMPVQVGGLSSLTYLWYLISICVLLAWFVWRRRRLANR